MNWRTRLSVNTLLLFCLLLQSAYRVTLRAQDVYEVRIGGHSFVPPANRGQLLERKTRHTLRALPDGQQPILLQFYELPSESVRNTLAARGVQLYDYLGGRAYLASVKPGFQARLASEGALRSIVEIDPRWKVSPLLDNGAVPPHAVAPRGGVRVNVVYHAGVGAKCVLGSLLKMGLKAEHVSEVFRTVGLTLPADTIKRLAEEAWVVAIHPAPAPAELDNYRGRVMNGSHQLTRHPSLGGRGLRGAGVRIGVFDGDVEHHVDFGARVHVQENAMPVASNGGHGVHVSGTLAGAGLLDPKALGVAPRADLYTYNFMKMSNGLSVSEKMLKAARDFRANITQNSYGVAIKHHCKNYNRFSYNGLEVSWDVDYVSNIEPTLLHVYSVGNDRGAGDNCGHTYGTSAKRSKNALYVGALDANGEMSSYSSWGPMDDGRLLPTVVAFGTNVYSARPSNSYGEGTGSSMACPSVSGVAALLTERYRQLNRGATPQASLLRGVIANTARAKGAAGPDYQHGYGLVDARRAVETIEKGWYFVGELKSGAAAALHVVDVPRNAKELRAMLVWTDTVSSKAYAYGEPALINDLDLEVIKDGAATLPWVLDASRPEAPARRGVDKINNIEQVTIASPSPGRYELKVAPTAIASCGQHYVVVYWVEMARPAIVYPRGGESLAPGDRFYIRWDGLEGPVKVEISLDDERSYVTIAENVIGTELEWVIPAATIPTATARVRLRAANGIVKNQQPFSIIGVPANVRIEASECSIDDWTLRWDKVENVASYEVLKANVEEGDYKVIATVKEDSVVIPQDAISQDQRNVYTVRSRLKSGSTGRRAKGVIMESAVPLVLTAKTIPFVENFEKYPSPHVQLVRGKNMTMGYISSYPGISVRPGHHLVTSYGARGQRADDWDVEDVFATEGNKNRLKMCGVDLTHTGYSELHLTLRITQMYFHQRQNSSARVLINGLPVADVNGTTVIQAAEPQSTDVRTLCYDLTPYLGQKVNIEVQHVAKDVGCMMVVESVKIAPPEASGFLELTRLTTTGLVAGASPRNDVTVEVLNNQPKKVEALAFSYTVDNGSAVVESITNLKPYERRKYTFLTRVDLTSKEELGKIFNLTARILHPDTLNATARCEAINTGEVYALAYSPWDEVPFVGLVKDDPKETVTVDKALLFTPHRGAYKGYEENQQSTVRFIPADSTKKLRVFFKRFDTEKGADGFYVYNCEVPENLALDKVQHTDLLTGTLTDHELLASTKRGDITFTFSSDISISGEGWLAYITEEKPENKFTLAPVALENHYATQKAPIVITVRNNTGDEQRNVRVGYNVNGSDIWDVETIHSIPAHDSVVYTFPTPADVPFGGHYTITVRILSPDYDTSDNEVSAAMTNDTYCHGASIEDFGSLFIKEVVASDGSKVSTQKGAGSIDYYQTDALPIYRGSTKTRFTLRTNKPLGEGDAAVLYIDWNGDVAFDDDAERYDVYSEQSDKTYCFTIDVPTSAIVGETRMRAMVGPKNALASACPAALAYGDIKDLKAEIVNAPFPVNDVAVTSVAVKSGKGLSAEESVTVTLRNFGAEDISSLAITMTVNGAATTEPASVTIPAFNAEEVSYTLQRKLDMRTAGKYDVQIRIPDDQNMDNNEVSATAYSVAPPRPDAFFALKFKREPPSAEGIDLGTLRKTPMYAANGHRDATFEAWIMPQEEGRNVLFSGKNILIFANTERSQASAFPTNSLVVQFVADPTRPTMTVVTEPGAVTPNQWQHVAVAMHLEHADRPENFRVYINGKRQTVKITNPNFRCYGKKNGDMPVRAADGFGGMVRQIRCWKVQLHDSVLTSPDYKYKTLRDGEGKLPDGLLAEYTFTEGPGSAATASGEDIAVVQSERLGMASDPVWVTPTSLITDVQLEGQLFPAEFTAPNHFTVPIAEDVDISSVKGAIIAAWPGTKLKQGGEEIDENTGFDFRQPGNQISVEATVDPKYIFGQVVASQTYTISVEKVAPINLQSLAVEQAKNPGLSADVVASIAPEMRLDLKGIADATRVNLSFTASAGAILKVKEREIKSGINTVDLTSPVELTLVSADGRQSVRYMLEAFSSQEIAWAKIASSYEYGDAPQVLNATSTSALPILYSSSDGNVATVNGSQLYITGIGNATLQASQLGGSGWAPAVPRQQTIEVRPRDITVAPKTITEEELQPLPEMQFDFVGLVDNAHASSLQLPQYQVIVNGAPWEKPETLIPVGEHILRPVDASSYQSGNYRISPKEGTLRVTTAAAVKVVTFHVVNGEGQDVKAATISINHDAYTTDRAGTVAVRLRPDVYKYSVAADGYILAQGEVTVATENFQCKVTLQQPRFTLSYSSADAKQGKIIGETEQRVANGGSGTSVYAVPAPGYAFVSWSDGLKANPRLDENVIENKSVQARFELFTFVVVYEVEGPGRIEGEAMQRVTYGGKTEVVTAVPDEGYVFVRWSDGLTQPKREDVVQTDNITLTAVFDKYPTLPYSQNFDASLELPNFWRSVDESKADRPWYVSNSQIFFVDPIEGNTAFGYASTHASLYSPTFAIKESTDADVVVKFQYKGYPFPAGLSGSVQYRTNKTTWADLGALSLDFSIKDFVDTIRRASIADADSLQLRWTILNGDIEGYPIAVDNVLIELFSNTPTPPTPPTPPAPQVASLLFVVTEGAAVLQGATVALENVGTKETDAQGKARFDGLQLKDYSYTVSKFGYTTVQATITLKAGGSSAAVVMVKEATPVESELLSKVTLRPNPARGALYVENVVGVESLSVVSLRGEELLLRRNADGASAVSIDLGKLAEGIYLLRVECKGAIRAIPFSVMR